MISHQSQLRGQTFSSFRAKSPLYRSLFIPSSFIPANPQQSTGSRYRANSPQYCYRKTLEKLREAPLLLCPWNFDRLRSMLTTLYPRNLAHYYCLELATVKMPPAPLRILMDMHSIPHTEQAHSVSLYRTSISTSLSPPPTVLPPHTKGPSTLISLHISEYHS